MSRRPQQAEQAERVDGGGEALQRRPSDRAAKRASSIAANRQKQLNALMALGEGSSCHSSDEGEHVARASSILDEDFGDPPEEAACSPTSRRLSVGQAMSSPSI